MANHRAPIPDWLNKKYFQEVLKESLNDANLTVNSIEIKPGSKEGDNYSCQVFRIFLNFSSSSKTNENLTLIGKLKPKTALMNELAKMLDEFATESSFFSVLQPKLNKVLQDFPNAKQFTPKCFHVDLENKIIFMEDLKEKQFEMQERSKFLNLQQAEIVLETLATFHGLSLHVLKDFPEMKEKFHEYTYRKNLSHPVYKLMRNAALSLEKHAKNYGLPEKYTKKLLALQKECDDGKLGVVDVQEGKLNALCHGDCWINNVLFHFQDGAVDDVILLDFQVVHYNSFATDLHYFLFSSVSAELLTTKLDYLLEKYFLKLKEISPDDGQLTLERVKTEFAERYYFGYIMAVTFRPYITAETPVDFEAVLFENRIQDYGFVSSPYIRDLELLLPLFEKVGII